MSQTCPVCGRPVDPLRARAVGVRDGKIVAYDTAECARAAETKPTAMPAALASALAAADPAKPEPKADAGRPTPQAEAEAEAESRNRNPKAEAESRNRNAKAEAAKPEPKEAGTSKRDTKSKASGSASKGSATESKASASASKGSGSESKASEASNVSAAASRATDSTASATGTKARGAESKASEASNASAAASKASGAAAEAGASASKASATSTREGATSEAAKGKASRDGASADADHDEDTDGAKAGASRAASNTHGDDDSDADAEGARSSGGRTLAVLAVLVLGGAGAFLAYRYLIAPAQPEAPPVKQVMTPAPAAIDAAPPDAPEVTAADAVAKAREVLKRGLADGTPRVQRVAAAALARTGDADALAVLADALAKETVDAAKLELAYAMARGGDPRGAAALVAALGSGRRDTKLEAGRRLALLGDPRATRTLAAYLDVVQLRLGTAEVLAHLADPRAIEVLTKIRDAGAEASSHDDWARATIALGIAGRTDVAADLHTLLTEDGFKPFAASALARLHDPAARPVLAALLAFPSLRVEAARSLRVLDPSGDTAAERATLLAALTAEKDTVQLQVAEALLVLAGDPAWAEHP